MAREDLLANLLRELMTKEEAPPPDDNVLIQKMVSPYDNIYTDENVTVITKTTAKFKWGGYNPKPVLGDTLITTTEQMINIPLSYDLGLQPDNDCYISLGDNQHYKYYPPNMLINIYNSDGIDTLYAKTLNGTAYLGIFADSTNYIQPGWLWNQGQYSYDFNNLQLSISELITGTDSITVINSPIANFVWGGKDIKPNWLWNQGQWK